MIDLLDYGFNNIKSKILKKKNEVITKINISHGDKRILNIGLKNDLMTYFEVDDLPLKKTGQSYSLWSSVTAPVR